MDRVEKESLIAQMVRNFNDDELSVVLRFVGRLTNGREVYGELDIDNDPRDWCEESMEEMVDDGIYKLIEMEKFIRRMRACTCGAARLSKSR